MVGLTKLINRILLFRAVPAIIFTLSVYLKWVSKTNLVLIFLPRVKGKKYDFYFFRTMTYHFFSNKTLKYENIQIKLKQTNSIMARISGGHSFINPVSMLGFQENIVMTNIQTKFEKKILLWNISLFLSSLENTNKANFTISKNISQQSTRIRNYFLFLFAIKIPAQWHRGTRLVG